MTLSGIYEDFFFLSLDLNRMLRQGHVHLAPWLKLLIFSHVFVPVVLSMVTNPFRKWSTRFKYGINNTTPFRYIYYLFVDYFQAFPVFIDLVTEYSHQSIKEQHRQANILCRCVQGQGIPPNVQYSFIANLELLSHSLSSHISLMIPSHTQPFNSPLPFLYLSRISNSKFLLFPFQFCFPLYYKKLDCILM